MFRGMAPTDGAQILQHGYLWAFGSAFLGGFLTSLTPCVYPMIGITVSLFGAREENTGKGKAMALAASYVGGMAVMYTALGVAFGLASRQFGTFMANPWVMVPIALLLIALAFSMFGAFELALPSGLQQRLSGVGGKGFAGAFLMGLVGGLIAAPCTGPILSSVLLYITVSRNALLGGALMFTYAIGMGLLFFAVAGFAMALPRSGKWMEYVKSLMGTAMISLALYFLRPVFAPLGKIGDYHFWFLGTALSVLAIGFAVGGIHLSFHDGWGIRLRKAFGVALLVAGSTGIVGWFLAPKPLEWVHDESTGVKTAKAAAKPVLLDFYADWCLPCKEMDVKTFSDDKVRDALGKFTLVKVNLTQDDDPAVVEVKNRYGAMTLPTVVLLDKQGNVAKKFDHLVEPAELLPVLAQLQ
jgi:thiol:disulfide interchange protein DsbD